VSGANTYTDTTGIEAGGNGDIVDPDADSDGDFIKDKEEQEFGRNALVADIPELQVRFLQNYRIETTFKKGEESKLFVIDTKVGVNDPDFKYRVGKIFIRDKSFQNAATIGKFSSHSWGDIENYDLTRIKYPEVAASFFHNEALKNKQYLDEGNKIENISVALENSVKLSANKYFKSINNLEINFYYYDYETESYELLATKKVDRHFNAGVNETFEVVLDNLPRKLLEENYFKKGEFIISEINDYEIPDLNTTYKLLRRRLWIMWLAFSIINNQRVREKSLIL